MPIAALNPMPNYNNHRLLRMKDAEKVNKIETNNMLLFLTINLI
jgi:hypothetical protein